MVKKKKGESVRSLFSMLTIAFTTGLTQSVSVSGKQSNPAKNIEMTPPKEHLLFP